MPSLWAATTPKEGLTYKKQKKISYSESQTVYNTKGTRAHTHRELIREWLWEPTGVS